MDLSHFDESRFVPLPFRARTYKQFTERGKNTIKKRSVVIAGLARDVAPVLGKTMARIERTGAMFSDYKVVIFENDSKDNTAKQLEQWAQANAAVTVVSERRGDPVNPGLRCLNRAERMAVYRNKYRELIADKYSDYDYVIVIDTDLPGGWSYDGICNTFGQDVDWDFVGSNGLVAKNFEGTANRLLYYDAWAFRWEDSWSPVTPVSINNKSWPRGEPMLKVNSAFGGLGIYKTKAMSIAKYDGTDCEHVPFHRKMTECGMTKLFMNPSQITLY